MKMKTYKDVDSYIVAFPKEVQANLKLLRQTIKKLAPKAEEGISYGMPGYKLGGPLVYFAAFKEHIGFYPTPTGVKAFEKDLSKYKTSKGAVQFPLTEKIPLALVTKIIKFRIKQNSEKENNLDFPKIGAPAERALLNAKIKNLNDLSKLRETDVVRLHGMGPKALGILKSALKKAKMSFRK